ncbi:MAG: cytochrome c oxidase subunit 3 [Proteobacteria bacterium]|nr:cytochrome c oxidase subunit 3 [Pseudomonadota bacterium]
MDAHSATHTSTSPQRTPDMFNTASHGKVGMWMFLGTDALTFSGFLIGYGVLRARNPQWPDPAHYLGIGLSAFATFILICSSVTMVIAQAAGEVKDSKKMLRYLLFTILGGIIFLSIQAYEYTHLMHHTGMIFSDFKSGPPQFASTFYVITGFHGFHVFSGVVYLCIMAVRTWLGKYDNGNVNHVEICGLFWHFVDLVWILVFTFIYLI